MRPISRSAQKRIREYAESIRDHQLRDYGVDPSTEILILKCKDAIGRDEWRAFGATRKYSGELIRAGFVWDRRRLLWWTNAKPLDLDTAPVQVMDYDKVGS